MYKLLFIAVVLFSVLFVGCGSNVEQVTQISGDTNATQEMPSREENNTTEETNTTHNPLRIACVGDSLTQGFGYENAKNESYPIQLASLIDNTSIEVRNFGIENKTAMHSADDPYKNTNIYAQSKSFKPDTVVIMFGTNDVKDKNWDKKDKFIAEYTTLIQSYIDLPSKPKVYVCLPTPSHKDSYTITNNKIKHDLIPKIKEIAKTLGLETIDLHTPFENKMDSFITDGLHLNKQGSKEVAEIVYERIY